MPSRPDVTKLIADHWHNLPHEDGRPRRLMHFSQFGVDEDTKQRIGLLGLDLADSVQHLLEINGYTITHRDDPKAADEDGYKTARFKCLRCGHQLAQFGVDDAVIATLSPLARRSLIAALETDCPHD